MEAAERNCECGKDVMKCAHLDGYRVILTEHDECFYAALCKDGGFFPASAATGTKDEMTEHFKSLDSLMRDGVMERLMEFADA